jgi:hypothetical protein
MKPDSLMRGPVFRVRGAVVRHSSAVCVVAATVKYKWSECGGIGGIVLSSGRSVVCV